jgi:predicted DNA-binding transcriptional regulator YafY
MWKPANFNEACQRAAGRRAYNKQRRLARERRITLIIALQSNPDFNSTGRELAALFKVHEATISRDLKFIRRLRCEYRKMSGEEMSARSFRFLRGGGYETVFEIHHGVRVR